MKYVACYARVSTDEQKKFGFSIQAQKDALEKYCKENGYKSEFYIDEGISASSMKKRKALNEMLSKCSAFDMILFTKLDRLSRNVLDANNINKLLMENNCTMKAIDEDDIDTSTADGTFIFNLKVSLAQREIGKTSERIKFVFQNKREKGEITSGTKKYGYDIVDKHYTINEVEAENIRSLYKEYIKNNGSLKDTYTYFVKHFASKGYDAMISYLKDSAYIGKYKLYRKDIYLDNYIPAIIDIDLWNNVQSLRKKKTVSRKNSIEGIFAGLLFCSNCGLRLTKKVDNRVKKVVIRYCCDNNYRLKVGIDEKKCMNSKSIRQDYIEKYLLDNLENEINKYKIKNIQDKKEPKKDYSNDIKSIEKKMEKLKDLYLDDLIDKEVYIKDYKALNSKLNEFKNVMYTKPTKKNFSIIDNLINSNYKEIYANLSDENKKRFWLSFIDKILINDGKIEEIIFL